MKKPVKYDLFQGTVAKDVEKPPHPSRQDPLYPLYPLIWKFFIAFIG